MSAVELAPVDAVDVTIVVDNAIDMLAAETPVAKRPPMVWDWAEQEQLRAEHGYGLWVTIERTGRRDTLLYDAGLGRDTAAHNLDVLGYDLRDIRAAVFSHGHIDHHSGLEGISRRLGRRSLPLVLHPDAWRDRRVRFPSGTEIHLPGPSHQDLDREGWEVVEERGPSLLLDGAALVTGQVERTTPFEKGFPIHDTRAAGGGWEPDVWVWDDQAVVVHLRGKGLIVLSSCSHAGIINMVTHARRLTGIEQVYACVGGMHLTGGLFESIIPQTVDALCGLEPQVVVPGHCTGWRAANQIVTRLPEAYVQSNVGTRLHFTAAAD
jgi:7,8-dihydropterin-6-yl-methyl-4-(beta-D-ribofuranosyl)aminobenzene 5'-phosphate synthase